MSEDEDDSGEWHVVVRRRPGGGIAWSVPAKGKAARPPSKKSRSSVATTTTATTTTAPAASTPPPSPPPPPPPPTFAAGAPAAAAAQRVSDNELEHQRETRTFNVMLYDLQCAIDSLYLLCESASAVECDDLVTVLETARVDFSALADRHHLLDEYLEDSNTSGGIAWEVRKSTSRGSTIGGGGSGGSGGGGGALGESGAVLSYADSVRRNTSRTASRTVTATATAVRDSIPLIVDDSEWPQTDTVEDNLSDSDTTPNPLKRSASLPSHANATNVSFNPPLTTQQNALHERLSSPQRRRRSIEELRRAEQERMQRAAQLREELHQERALKLRRVSERVKGVHEAYREKRRRAQKQFDEKMSRAAELRGAHLRERVRKAQEEEAKVQEVAFIASLEAENRRREAEAREEQERARAQVVETQRSARRASKAAREEAVQRRRRELEEMRLERNRLLLVRRRAKETQLEQEREQRERERERERMERREMEERRREERRQVAQATKGALQQRLDTALAGSEKRREEHLRERSALATGSSAVAVRSREESGVDGSAESESGSEGESSQTSGKKMSQQQQPRRRRRGKRLKKRKSTLSRGTAAATHIAVTASDAVKTEETKGEVVEQVVAMLREGERSVQRRARKTRQRMMLLVGKSLLRPVAMSLADSTCALRFTVAACVRGLWSSESRVVARSIVGLARATETDERLHAELEAIGVVARMAHIVVEQQYSALTPDTLVAALSVLRHTLNSNRRKSSDDMFVKWSALHATLVDVLVEAVSQAADVHSRDDDDNNKATLLTLAQLALELLTRTLELTYCCVLSAHSLLMRYVSLSGALYALRWIFQQVRSSVEASAASHTLATHAIALCVALTTDGSAGFDAETQTLVDESVVRTELCGAIVQLIHAVMLEPSDRDTPVPSVVTLLVSDSDDTSRLSLVRQCLLTLSRLLARPSGEHLLPDQWAQSASLLAQLRQFAGALLRQGSRRLVTHRRTTMLTPHTHTLLSDCLTDTIHLLGLLVRSRQPHLQDLLRHGATPTLLQSMCRLPIHFFTLPKFQCALLPTLAAACHHNPASTQVVSAELSLQLITDFFADELLSSLPSVVRCFSVRPAVF